MFCSISGEVPQEPVASRKSGHLYEKRLILKHLQTDGRDPVTGEDLDPADLIELQVNKTVRPRPLTATSIPGMLTLFQNEWDELMLETYALKQSLATTRQELAQALYEHDAACRVIARLVRERDEARAMLSAYQQGGYVPASNGGAAAMEIGSSGISDAILGRMQEKSDELSRTRKGRKAPPSLATKDSISSYTATVSATPHKASKPGVLSVDIHPTEHNLLLSGGVDGTAVVFDTAANKVAHKLAGHSKKVTHAIFHPDANQQVAITASADKTVKVWSGDSYREAMSFSEHDSEISAVSVHPVGDYFASFSHDSSWCFYDLPQGRCLRKVESGSNDPYHCGAFHPDGLILATGSANGVVSLWDMRKQEAVAALSEHQGAVNSLCFSENGYSLATGSADGSVRVWDLRKLNPPQSRHVPVGSGTPVNAVAYDRSGSYLAFASDAIYVAAVKPWAEFATLSGHSSAVTSIKFGPDASFIASASMDRSIRVFSA